MDINWYKLSHIGRCINIQCIKLNSTIPNWIEDFLVKFKKSKEDGEGE